jgi:hypothetical protein
MITAKQILEAYLTRLPLTHKKGTFEVFENPTLKELRSADSTGLGIRFTADISTKTVYAWDLDAVIHSTVETELGLKNKGERVSYGWSNLLTGVAERKVGHYVMVHSDFFYSIMYYERSTDIELALEMLNQDWSWANKYIRITPYLEKIKETILEIKR